MKKLSIPMEITLYSMWCGDPIPYPAGQKRLIIQALFDRGLVDESRMLTQTGRVEADRVSTEVKENKWLPRTTE